MLKKMYKYKIVKNKILSERKCLYLKGFFSAFFLETGRDRPNINQQRDRYKTPTIKALPPLESG